MARESLLEWAKRNNMMYIIEEFYNGGNEKNPMEISRWSHMNASWKCNKGHEWSESVYTRCLRKLCPYCSGRLAIKGETDLATKSPELLEEWNYEKNTISPYELLPSSGKKVWWKCNKGHEWLASPNNRQKGTGCPVCSNESSTSFPELAIVFYLRKKFIVENRKKIFGKEVDIFVSSLNFGIEYDGMFYHNTEKAKLNDEKKTVLFRESGINFMRIKEAKYTKYDLQENLLYIKFDPDYAYVKDVMMYISHYIKQRYGEVLDVNVDIKNDRINILNMYKSMKRKKSLAELNPSLCKEWNYEKNGDLNPEYFDANSRYKVWWKCKKGHEWQAAIYTRNVGNGCPFCANQKVLKGYNDLATLYPEIADEWDMSKNDVTPDMFTPYSDTRAWWKCTKGHQWEAAIKVRTNGSNCPYCANKKVLKGYNDLYTWCLNNDHQYLINEFDQDKNKFSMYEITPFSSKNIWWICNNNHSYCTSSSHRIRMGTNCPYCSHKKLLTGYNDLATTNPEIAKEWYYEKNDGIKPTDVMAGSNIRKYWFKCEQGHIYSSTLLERKRKGSCPICKKQK